MNIENFLKIAADSVETLRRVDVCRVLDQDLEYKVTREIAKHISIHRPDLREEVADCLREVVRDRFPDVKERLGW